MSEFTVRKRGKVRIVKTPTRLDINNAEILFSTVHGLTEKGQVYILLDMKNTTEVDFSAIRRMIDCSMAASRKGGGLRLLGPLNENLASLLSLTKLTNGENKPFRVFENEDIAVHSFRE